MRALMQAAPFMRGFRRMAREGWRQGWHEAGGGNLSCRLRAREVDFIRPLLAAGEKLFPLGFALPQLAGESFLFSGRGKSLRGLSSEPEKNAVIITLDQAGENYCPRWGAGVQPSSELPTHLMGYAQNDLRVIYHNHAPNLIALSFVLPPDSRYFSRRLWAMLPECAMLFPEGVGVIPWTPPGGREIAQATAQMLARHNIVIWAQHGALCAGSDFEAVFALAEAAEKAAEILVKVLSMGGVKYGPGLAELRALGQRLNLPLNQDFL
jgi:rhamnulose-1-phosphate aldolase